MYRSILMCQILILFGSGEISCNASSPIVELPKGKIEGTIKASTEGRAFYSFEGVPYANPPVERNRFREPQPLEPWSYVKKANKVYKCLQYKQMNQPSNKDPIVGDEDCLYLNIATPNLDQHANLSVIVFIHGGAFMFNYAACYGPEILLNNDVVFVTFTYRLGPLGFLSTEDDVVPGNNGLKDQIAALQWIQENIRYFGGNPNSVTIAGNSAGGASVHFHYLMKQSRGLFHRGFSESGTALNPWVIMERPLEKTQEIAALVNCTTKENAKMIECLKKRSGRSIVKAVKHFQPWLYNPFSPFAVVVDTWASNPLLSDHPYQLLKKKLVYDVPWIASHVNSEGLYPAAEFYSNDQYLDDLNTKWDDIIPHVLHYNETSEDPGISRKIRQHYLGNEDVSKKTYDKLVQLIGDRLFVVDIHKSVKLHAAATNGSAYMYYFAYRGKNSRSEVDSGSDKNFGAAHGDDDSYIMYLKMIDTLATEGDRKMSNLLTQMWLSVARTGYPRTPIKWTPVAGNLKNVDYLKIASAENLAMSDETLGHQEFWNSLPLKENEHLFKDQS